MLTYLSPHAPKLAATWPLPSNEGCRPPNVNVGGSWDGLMGWEQVGNTRGDPWYGRPTRYVRRGAMIGSPTFNNFHSVCILILKTRLDTCRPLMHPAPSRPRHHHLLCMQERSLRRHFPRMQDQAGGGDSWAFIPAPPPSHARASWRWAFNTIHAPSTSLACQIEPEVDIHGVSPSFTPLPPPLHARASRR